MPMAIMALVRLGLRMAITAITIKSHGISGQRRPPACARRRQGAQTARRLPISHLVFSTSADGAGMTYLLLAAGLVLLLLGGELLVRGAVAVAERFAVSPLLIGLTLVGFGTSTPELVASINAALAGAPGIAIGNVVGSNIANILLILGSGARLRPLATQPEAFRRDGPVLLGASALLVAICLLGEIGRPIGTVLLALLLAYTLWTWRTERVVADAAATMHAAEAEVVGRRPRSLPLALATALAGIAGVVWGADLLVRAAIELAQSLGVSDAVIGLSIVAVGTSLPELATTVVATLRRQSDVAFGNIVGSNIFNVLGILGVTALVQPLAVPASIARFDVWVMLAVAVVGIAFAITGWRLSRLEGGLLLGAYALYVGVIFAWPA
jgi:cation:H+ antiporter